MRLTTGMKNSMKRLSVGSASLTPWRVGRVLALGALLAIGTGLYFNMTAASESPDLFATSQAEDLSASEDQQRVVDSMQKRLDEAGDPEAISAVRGAKDFSEDAWRSNSPYYDDFRADEGSSALHRDLVERLRVDVQQEAGSWDANEPVASPSVKPSAESLPGGDDYYWPPVLENYHSSQPESIIDVQQEAGSWDANEPAAVPFVKPSSDSSTGISAVEGAEDFPEDAWRSNSPYYDDFQANVNRPTGFLSQGRAGYSVREQMEILEEANVEVLPTSPRVERLSGFLNQGRAGYSVKEQMEILEEANSPGSYHQQRAADSLEERLEVQWVMEAMQSPSESRGLSYHQQRVADSLEERLEAQRVLEAMQSSRESSTPSYHQQRVSDSIQERLEVQRALQAMPEQ